MLDANALTVDAAGLAFLADALGTAGEAERSGRSFPADVWTPRAVAQIEPAERVSIEDLRQVELA